MGRVCGAAVHPDLQADEVLATQRVRGERGDVLDRAGRPLVTQQPVVDVGVQPSRATDVDAPAAALAGVLDYDAVRDVVQPLPGTVFRQTNLPLSPTRDSARPLLGRAGGRAVPALARRQLSAGLRLS